MPLEVVEVGRGVETAAGYGVPDDAVEVGMG
jgi:hypothetical protein